MSAAARGAAARRLGRVVLLLTACLLVACGDGRTLPDVEAMHLDGAPFRTSTLRGRPAWLEFWAPWDPASQQRLRDLAGIAKRHPDWSRRLHLVLVAVDCQPSEAREALPAGIADSFQVVVETGEVGRAVGIGGVPATLLVDAQGRYRYLHEGYVEPAVLEGTVESLISGTSGTARE